MAQWNRVLEATPEEVWAVLSDGRRYARWVVGTHDSWERDDHWPAVDAELGYALKLGPWTYHGRTISRRCEPIRRLELEAATHLGSARISFLVEPWGSRTLVLVDEHPLRGPAARWHNSAADLVLRWRHRQLLARLEKAVLSARARSRAGAPGDARPSSGPGDGNGTRDRS
ncbi:SRPBCC family protein [Streptomyces globisporus]|uniref:SRPBCC family protein n=1 Tax=Streptomyces globisporus TaxID=1908 RepID=UPI0004C574CD|nr:SRPBCC family protein [Streptomyces globisporus]